MKIFPAIDIKDGRVVRLTQGDYNRVSVYDCVPEETAADFAAAGADSLHVVDLDGAKGGDLTNFSTVSRIVSATGMFVEVGGGIRDIARIEKYLSLGVGRVILGTAAAKNLAFLSDAVKRYGEKIAVGVDAKDGFVAVNGWTSVTQLDGVEFCKKLKQLGVKNVIYTDIARDGAMSGVNLPLYERLGKIEGLGIVASGGVSSLEDVSALSKTGVAAAIIGKALYTGAVDLKAAILCAEGAKA